MEKRNIAVNGPGALAGIYIYIHGRRRHLASLISLFPSLNLSPP